jgi:hypothetical protein
LDEIVALGTLEADGAEEERLAAECPGLWPEFIAHRGDDVPRAPPPGS